MALVRFRRNEKWSKSNWFRGLSASARFEVGLVLSLGRLSFDLKIIAVRSMIYERHHALLKREET